MLALAALFALQRFVPAGAVGSNGLERLGRNSLFVYWIHVELVYGYATWLVHGRLHLWQMAIAFGLFLALMFFALNVRDRFVGLWRARPVPPLEAGPTAAAV